MLWVLYTNIIIVYSTQSFRHRQFDFVLCLPQTMSLLFCFCTRDLYKTSCWFELKSECYTIYLNNTQIKANHVICDKISKSYNNISVYFLRIRIKQCWKFETCKSNCKYCNIILIYLAGKFNLKLSLFMRVDLVLENLFVYFKASFYKFKLISFCSFWEVPKYTI